MTAPSLLPGNSTPWEMALSETSAARRPLDADLVRRVRDPWACPAELLPYLAHALGLRLWFEDWSEYRKRSAIAQSITLRRLEGTLAGVERHLALVDTTIRHVVRPPATTYLSGGVSDADRERWIAGLPQIRFFPFATAGEAPAHRAFLGRRAWLGHMHVAASRGPQLHGRRATFQMPGLAEAPVTVDVLADLGEGPAERVRIDFEGARRRLFLGHGHVGGWLRGSRAAGHVVSVRLSEDAPSAFVAASGLTVQDVRPVRVFARRTAPAGTCFLGRDHLGARHPHLRASAGPRLVYDRIALLDPNAAGTPELRRGRSFLGRCRLGIRPYHAELLLDVPMSRPRFRAGLGRRGFVGSGALRPASLEPVRRARRALGVAKALDDTILYDTEIWRPVALGSGLPLGSYSLGQLVRRH